MKTSTEIDRDPNRPAASDVPARTAASIRRVWSLARAELALLARNRTAMLVGIGFPIATVLMFHGFGIDESDLDLAAMTVVSLIGLALLYVVYYNLVSAYVARREDLVLKRLRTGELTDAEILTGAAVPAVGLAVGQVLVAIVGCLVVLDLEMPVNPVLVVVAVMGGSAVFVLLAAVSTVFTRNVEMAQMSTVPVFGVSVVFSGMLFPLDAMAERVGDVVQFLPMTPVIELSRLGLVGTTGDAAAVGFAESFGQAAVPAAILAGWIVVGTSLTRRWFRWEPRR